MEKEKNKWKIVFWWYFVISIILLLFVVGFSTYTVIDQAYTIMYRTDEYERIINEQKQIILFYDTINDNNKIKREEFLYHFLEKDSAFFDQVFFIYDNDTLKILLKPFKTHEQFRNYIECRGGKFIERQE
ncbi:MAG: hypothetical protein LBN95_11715 [Prevotellaceae bacterium]|jgi:hypothetical protein|nr:hypothetical protein [Prevotellaceae bacterium]